MAGSGFLGRGAPEVKPVVAVTDFENKASFSGQWKLGQGMADILTTKLVESERVVVLERRNIGDVVGELARQGQDIFRPEGRVERGRLKNAQYLVRGSVTDFTVVGNTEGWFGVQDKGAIRGRGERAKVSLHLQVSDVGSGEVVASVKAEGEASAGGLGAEVNYRGLTLGGEAFFRTPLGKATERAMAQAVRKILHDLPHRPWEARVAAVDGAKVVVNGGEDAGVRVGDVFVVRGRAREVTDPVTGNVIDTVPGGIEGRIRVETVKETASYAVLEEGRAERGQVLEQAP